MPGTDIPIRDLQVGRWAYLETCGIVKIVAISMLAESAEIEWDAAGTPLVRHFYQPMHGFWSGLFDDFPTITVYNFPR